MSNGPFKKSVRTDRDCVAAASSPEFAQITAENYATSQKGLFEQEVGKVTYSAADRELDLLQEVLLAVAMKYVSWRLAEKVS